MRDNPGVEREAWPPVSGDGCLGPAPEEEIREWSLVLAAVGIAHTVTRGPKGYILQLQPFLMESAVRELQLWRTQVPLPQATIPAGGQWHPALFIPLLPVLLHLFNHLFFVPDEPVRLFGLSGSLLAGGDFWRPVTALFVHSGVFHLLFNIILLVLIAPFLRDSLGSGMSWTAILLLSWFANAAAALVRQPEIISIGASTAVFVVIGMALVLRMKYREDSLWKRGLLVAGTVLFFLAPGPSGQTDHLAHLFGGAFGILGGIVLLAVLNRINIAEKRWQYLFGGIGIALLGLCFIPALVQ